MTDVPSLTDLLEEEGKSLIVLRSKMPGMLNQSASFNGVLGLTCEIPFTAYLNFPFTMDLEFANCNVLNTGMVP